MKKNYINLKGKDFSYDEETSLVLANTSKVNVYASNFGLDIDEVIENLPIF